MFWLLVSGLLLFLEGEELGECPTEGETSPSRAAGAIAKFFEGGVLGDMMK